MFVFVYLKDKQSSIKSVNLFFFYLCVCNKVFNTVSIYLQTLTPLNQATRRLFLKLHATILLHSKKMLGCFNPNLGQIWTDPNVGLKMLFKIVTQLQLLLSTVFFF